MALERWVLFGSHKSSSKEEQGKPEKVHGQEQRCPRVKEVTQGEYEGSQVSRSQGESLLPLELTVTARKSPVRWWGRRSAGVRWDGRDFPTCHLPYLGL